MLPIQMVQVITFCSHRGTCYTQFCYKNLRMWHACHIPNTERFQSATCALLHCPNKLKLCRHHCFGQSLSPLGQCRSAQVALWPLYFLSFKGLSSLHWLTLTICPKKNFFSPLNYPLIIWPLYFLLIKSNYLTSLYSQLTYTDNLTFLFSSYLK